MCRPMGRAPASPGGRSALPAASGLLGSVAPGAGGMIDSAPAAAGTVTKAAELIKNPMAAMPAATDMLASVAPEGASKMISSAATFAGVGTGAGAATGVDGGEQARRRRPTARMRGRREAPRRQ
ncbi:hypothetical protein G6F68_018448 [Rhizopus microsporus]|nr:hypothetical protein G6F68_018448 [Rhizopus microsporus]